MWYSTLNTQYSMRNIMHILPSLKFKCSFFRLIMTEKKALYGSVKCTSIDCKSWIFFFDLQIELLYYVYTHRINMLLLVYWLIQYFIECNNCDVSIECLILWFELQTHVYARFPLLTTSHTIVTLFNLTNITTLLSIQRWRI